MQKYDVIVLSEKEKVEIDMSGRNEADALKRTLIYITNEENKKLDKETKKIYKKLFS